MKIGIISDTHRFTKVIDEVVCYLDDCDLILHAGDNIDDTYYIEALTDKKVIGVKGNCDSYSEPGNSEETFTVEDKKFFLCHGHLHDVKYTLSTLLEKAELNNIDVVVFGHSHVPVYEEKRGVIFINPGSPSLPRGGSSRGFGKLTIENGEISYERIKL